MTYTIIRQKDQKVSLWSGGKSKELFLYPAHASYAARDFLIRIFSATVEDDPSNFTILQGFHRILMSLTGPLKLTYEGHGEALLEPFQSVEFEGGWNTTSYGKCTDIGIMLAEGWKGSLLAAGPGAYKYKEGFTGIYALADFLDISVKTGGETIPVSLGQGDFLLVENDTVESDLTLLTAGLYGAVIVRAWPVI